MIDLLAAATRWATLGERASEWCPHTPTSRQAEFLSLQCREALYGGAAGGGKSDALLMAALQYVHVPGYAAILFRRTYSDLALPGAIMARSHEWLAGTRAHWNGDKKTWTFPTVGAPSTLTFGFLDSDGDRFRYQSAEFQFEGFDETTQFPERWYLYLGSRLRRLKGSTVPLRMRGATNPGGLGHKWVKSRFVDGGVGRTERVFVPAMLSDNPHIDAETYREQLAILDATTRAQLERGRWIEDTSGNVYGGWRPELLVPRPPVDPSAPWRHILAWDFGTTDPCAWALIGWPKWSRVAYVLESEQLEQMLPDECAATTRDIEKRYRVDMIVGDEGGLGKGYAEEMRRRHGIAIQPAEKQNKLGYIRLVNGAMQRAELLVCHGNDELVKQLEELPWADDDHRAEADGFDNHLTDAMLYGWRAAWAFTEQDAPTLGPAPGSPEALDAEMRAHKQRLIKESLRKAAQRGRRLLAGGSR